MAQRKFYLHLLLAALNGILMVVVIAKAESIHVSLLVVTLTSVGLGVLQPLRGWLLALTQVLVIVVGFFIMKNDTAFMTSPVAEFCTYASVFPTLVGSFIGAFMKRAL
ncbi:MAG: hypothetical protein U0Y10_09330 [Spirosomataceae bacterium]